MSQAWAHSGIRAIIHSDSQAGETDGKCLREWGYHHTCLVLIVVFLQSRSQNDSATEYGKIFVVEFGHGQHPKDEQSISNTMIRHQPGGGAHCIDSELAKDIRIDTRGIRKHSNRCEYGSSCLGMVEMAWRFDGIYRARDATFHIVQHSAFPSRKCEAIVFVGDHQTSSRSSTTSSQAAYPVQLRRLSKEERKKQACDRAEDDRLLKLEEKKALEAEEKQQKAKRHQSQSSSRHAPSNAGSGGGGGGYRHSPHSPVVAAVGS